MRYVGNLSQKFSGELLFAHSSAQTAFVRAVTPVLLHEIFGISGPHISRRLNFAIL